MKIVDVPTIISHEADKVGMVLLDFYKGLGWNGNDFLDPCKIRVSQAIYDELYNVMYEKYPCSVSVGMFMVNKAPSVDDSIPFGKVHLLDGWVSPSKN